MRKQNTLEARRESLVRIYELALDQTFLPLDKRLPSPQCRLWEDVLADVRFELNGVCAELFNLAHA